MAERKSGIDELLRELKQVREELEVQMHLAAADARDEWENLERKWEHFRARAEVVRKATHDAAEDVGEALENLGHELRKGYARIRSLL